MDAATVFDRIAPEYDREFGRTLGRVLRLAMWRWLERAFPPGQHVLEMSCGTGEDAVHLAARGVRVLATDPSAGMLEVARAKVTPGMEDRLGFRRLAIEELDRLLPDGARRFDGAFSSFGGLNFVRDLAPVSRVLGALLKPGATLVLCVVGRFVPWEWLWFLVRARPGQAFRRLRRGGTMWRGVRVYYPTVRQVARAFEAEFHLVRTGGMGILLPPPYTEDWAQRRPRLVERLNRWERRVEEWPGAPWVGDHFLMEMVRRDGPQRQEMPA